MSEILICCRTNIFLIIQKHGKRKFNKRFFFSIILDTNKSKNISPTNYEYEYELQTRGTRLTKYIFRNTVARIPKRMNLFIKKSTD